MGFTTHPDSVSARPNSPPAPTSTGGIHAGSVDVKLEPTMT